MTLTFRILSLFCLNVDLPVVIPWQRRCWNKLSVVSKHVCFNYMNSPLPKWPLSSPECEPSLPFIPWLITGSARSGRFPGPQSSSSCVIYSKWLHYITSAYSSIHPTPTQTSLHLCIYLLLDFGTKTAKFWFCDQSGESPMGDCYCNNYKENDMRDQLWTLVNSMVLWCYQSWFSFTCLRACEPGVSAIHWTPAVHILVSESKAKFDTRVWLSLIMCTCLVNGQSMLYLFIYVLLSSDGL